ncbi:hypothetical protein RSAG8_05726, partial [Rhizoctonia solani AG-8 WAC10335]
MKPVVFLRCGLCALCALLSLLRVDLFKFPSPPRRTTIYSKTWFLGRGLSTLRVRTGSNYIDLNGR